MILHTGKCSKGKKKVTIGDILELIGKTTLFDAKLCADLENLIIELLLIFTLHLAVDYHGKFITKVYALVFPRSAALVDGSFTCSCSCPTGHCRTPEASFWSSPWRSSWHRFQDRHRTHRNTNCWWSFCGWRFLTTFARCRGNFLGAMRTCWSRRFFHNSDTCSSLICSRCWHRSHCGMKSFSSSLRGLELMDWTLPKIFTIRSAYIRSKNFELKFRRTHRMFALKMHMEGYAHHRLFEDGIIQMVGGNLHIHRTR